MDFSGSPKRWDRDYITPQVRQGLFLWYISGIFPAFWGMDYATYHLLGEPETAIEQQAKHIKVMELISIIIYKNK